MNEQKFQEEFDPQDFDEEFPEEIPDNAKPKISEEEKRLRNQIYAN